MTPVPTPTEAELEILRVLWDLGPSTVREIHDRIAQVKPIGYTTVLKQMQVMHQKGLLTRSERFRSHVYEPARSRTDTRQQMVGSMLRQVFDGSPRELLQSALAGRRVNAAELDEIRNLLTEYERRKK